MKMNRKRDRLKIIHDILFVIREKRGNVKPTHIIYKSNLSHKMLTEYMDGLIQKDFITEHTNKKGQKRYDLNDKGHIFLNEFKVIRSFLDSYGLDD